VAIANGIGAYIIPNGYAGLYNLMDIEHLTVLDEERVDHVNSSFAGSEAGHSRVKISKISNPDKYKRISEGLKKFGIGGLVISGGDDTGSVVVDLGENGIPCVHAPKTMDLDLQTYSVGGDSAVNKIAHIVEDIKTTGQTHNRVMIVEVFGRYAGHTAFRGGIAADADCILIPEIPVDFDEVYNHMKRIYTRRILNSDVFSGMYSIVVAEGIRNEEGKLFTETGGTDSFGHVKLEGAAKYVRRALETRMKADPEIAKFMRDCGMYVEGVLETPEIREVIPGHLVRSGATAAYDVSFGKEIGGGAVTLLINGITGVTVYGVVDGEVRYMPTREAIRQRYVNLELVAFYEQMDICFGRRPVPFKPTFRDNGGACVERFL
jgi:6-phosphofructokinase 1